MLKNKWLLIASLLLVASLVLAACAPQEVVVTVEVPGEDGEVVVVTATPAPDAEGGEDMAEGGEVAYEYKDAPYRVGVFSDITTVNYWAANGPDNTVWNSYVLPAKPAAFGLAEVTFQFVPALAVDYPEALAEEEIDGETYYTTTVTLREDYMWSDGTPVTANDWAFTADTVLKFGLISGNWASWYDANYLDHIEVVDDYTAKVVYSTKPGLARHEYGVLQAPILPAHFWADVAAEAGAPIDALGEEPSDEELAEARTAAQDNLFAVDASAEPNAGPFLFVQWEPGAFAESETNADYADTGSVITFYANGAYEEVNAAGESFVAYGDASGDVDLSYAVGPFVNSAIYSIYGTQDAAMLALKDGEIDFLLNPLGLQRGLLDQVVGDENLTVIENSVNGFRYLSFNVRRDPMSYTAFRQAVAILIDKEFVASTILQGVAFPLYTFVPEGNAAWYYGDVPKFGFNEDGTSMSREERINAAVALLQEAGFSWDGNVPSWDPDNNAAAQDPGALIMPDGQPVPELELLSPSPGYDPLRSTFAIWVETWMNEVGVPVTANLTGFNVIVQRVFVEQDFDMQILGWSLSIFPDYLYDFFSEEQAGLDGNNAGGWVNAEFEDLGTQLLSCEGIDACKEIADQMQIILSNEVPYVVLFDTGIIEVYNSGNIAFPYTETLSGLQFGGHSASDNVAVR